MDNKCECGGTKLISFPSMSEHQYADQYDYWCNGCGKTGVGWRFGGPVNYDPVPQKEERRDDDE